METSKICRSNFSSGLQYLECLMRCGPPKLIVIRAVEGTMEKFDAEL